jgi:hypothetical protein
VLLARTVWAGWFVTREQHENGWGHSWSGCYYSLQDARLAKHTFRAIGSSEEAASSRNWNCPAAGDSRPAVHKMPGRVIGGPHLTRCSMPMRSALGAPLCAE